MPKLYSFLCLFCMFFSANSQSVLSNNNMFFTFEQLNDSLDLINKKDKKYPYFLQLYLDKAKKEQNTQHLFEAYFKFSGYEPSAKRAHLFTDSLFEVAQKLPEFYYTKALQAKATNYYYEKDYINSLKYELQALDKINKEKDAYAYYKSIYGIGLVYFHIQEYNKAYLYFNQARVYFQKNNDYGHVQGYFNSLYREAFSLYYLKNYTESSHLLQTGLSKKKLLKPKDVDSKIAYFNFVLGLNLYQKAAYKESILLLNKQINILNLNNDFANLATLYYYMGLNYHQLENEEQAVVFFKKIDTIFKKQHYSSLEIKEAYTYLISYYEQKKEPNNQLLYTNSMIEVMYYLQNEYKLLSGSLHYNFDVNKLLVEKNRLENDLNSKNTLTTYLTVIGFVIILLLLLIALYNYRKRKQFVKNYNDLLQQRKNKNTVPILNAGKENTVLLDSSKVLNTNESSMINETQIKNKNTVVKELNKKAISKLEPLFIDFEQNKEFLNKNISLHNLAQQWNTNRTYLSEYINAYKEKTFNDYLSSLRISYFLDEAEQNKNWQRLKIEAIAERLGFSSARSFSNAFLKETGISPSFYLKQIKEN